MFNFPDAPTIGQVVNMPDGTCRAWDGVKWKVAAIGSGSGSGGSSNVTRFITNQNQIGYPGGVTTEQDLQTVALTAGLLATNGQALRIVAAGTFASQSTVRTIRLYFGATQIALYQSGTGGPFNWQIDAIVWRLGATSQYAKGIAFSGTNNVSGTNQQSLTSPAETLANAITIKTTGQSVLAQAATVVSNILMVEFLP